MSDKIRKMIGLYFFLVLSLNVYTSFGRSKINAVVRDVTLDIFSDPDGDSDGVIIKKVNESLQLRCERRGSANKLEKDREYVLRWTVPSKNRDLSTAGNQSILTIPRLQLVDTGHYTCTAQSDTDEEEISVFRYVSVSPETERPPNCSPKMFICGAFNRSANHFCIPNHYVCDGRIDCPGTGDDENALTCGTANACYGKLPCTDGRCIPNSWCCDPKSSNSNCHTLVRPRCCDEHTNEDFPDLKFHQANEERHQLSKEVGFLQMTIYTLTVCSLIILVAVVLLASAIIRVRRKRTAMNHRMAEILRHAHGGHTAPELRPTLSVPDELTETADSIEVNLHSPSRPTDFGQNFRRNSWRRGYLPAVMGTVGTFDSPVSTPRNRPFDMPAVGYSGPAHFCGTSYVFDEAADDRMTPAQRQIIQRANAIDRMLDRLFGPEDTDGRTAEVERSRERQPVVLRLGRLRVTLPRIFGRARTPRPHTVRSPTASVGSETYTRNGRTILLGAPFACHGASRANSPPTYMEAVGEAVPVEFLPPPPYRSTDDIVRQFRVDEIDPVVTEPIEDPSPTISDEVSSPLDDNYIHGFTTDLPDYDSTAYPKIENSPPVAREMIMTNDKIEPSIASTDSKFDFDNGKVSEAVSASNVIST